MSVASKVRTKAETQRRYQVDVLDERRARRQTQEQLAKSVLHSADKVNEMYAQTFQHLHSFETDCYIQYTPPTPTRHNC